MVTIFQKHRASIVLAILAAALLLIGWNYEMKVAQWLGAVLAISLLCQLAYRAVRTSQYERYPTEGSEPETWRSYH